MRFISVTIFKTCQTVASISMIRQFHEIFVLNFWRDFTIWPNCALQHRTQSVGAAAKIIDRLWCAWFPLALSAQGRRQEPARPPERMRMWGLQTGLHHDYLCPYSNQIMPTTLACPHQKFWRSGGPEERVSCCSLSVCVYRGAGIYIQIHMGMLYQFPLGNGLEKKKCQHEV